MIIKDVLGRTTEHFKKLGLSTPRLDAELLISNALGWERIDLYMQIEYPLDEEQLQKCRAAVQRRSKGEPVAYILGYRDFYKHKFKVNTNVLIPRPETELLVELALDYLKHAGLEGETHVVDFGCGSGCIGLSIVSEHESSQLVGIDLSDGAIQVAKENSQVMGLDHRVQFVKSDVTLLDAVNNQNLQKNCANIVVMNPPYIAPNDENLDPMVKKYEPHMALFAEDSGMSAIKKWAMIAAKMLVSGGWLGTEVGQGQARPIIDYLSQSGLFIDVEAKQDYSGVDRFVIGIRA